jgi:hypothetical protein
MITNLKIKASPVKGMPFDQLMKKLESGKMITLSIPENLILSDEPFGLVILERRWSSF